MPGKKILIADDEPFFVEVLTSRLVAAGYEVSSARNGEEVIARAKSDRPMLIIMDVMMPKMSGFEALQRIRQEPATKNIPAIVFSAKAGMKDFFADISNVEFFHKPFDFAILLERVGALIGVAENGAVQIRHAVLASVEDHITNKVRDLLIQRGFQVLVVLTEEEAVKLSKRFRPEMILCQFWEDEKILDPRKIAKELPQHPSIAKTPLYVFCKEPLYVEAMKHFRPERILTYKETSELLRKLVPVIQ